MYVSRQNSQARDKASSQFFPVGLVRYVNDSGKYSHHMDQLSHASACTVYRILALTCGCSGRSRQSVAAWRVVFVAAALPLGPCGCPTAMPGFVSWGQHCFLVQ